MLFEILFNLINILLILLYSNKKLALLVLKRLNFYVTKHAIYLQKNIAHVISFIMLCIVLHENSNYYASICYFLLLFSPPPLETLSRFLCKEWDAGYTMQILKNWKTYS